MHEAQLKTQSYDADLQKDLDSFLEECRGSESSADTAARDQLLVLHNIEIQFLSESNLLEDMEKGHELLSLKHTEVSCCMIILNAACSVQLIALYCHTASECPSNGKRKYDEREFFY